MCQCVGRGGLANGCWVATNTKSETKDGTVAHGFKPHTHVLIFNTGCCHNNCVDRCALSLLTRLLFASRPLPRLTSVTTVTNGHHRPGQRTNAPLGLMTHSGCVGAVLARATTARQAGAGARAQQCVLLAPGRLWCVGCVLPRQSATERSRVTERQPEEMPVHRHRWPRQCTYWSCSGDGEVNTTRHCQHRNTNVTRRGCIRLCGWWWLCRCLTCAVAPCFDTGTTRIDSICPLISRLDAVVISHRSLACYRSLLPPVANCLIAVAAAAAAVARLLLLLLLRLLRRGHREGPLMCRVPPPTPPNAISVLPPPPVRGTGGGSCRLLLLL